MLHEVKKPSYACRLTIYKKLSKYNQSMYMFVNCKANQHLVDN